MKGGEKMNSDKNKKLDKKVETKDYVYRCRFCGYVYDGDTLPDDMKCPVCGREKDYFEKIEK